MSCKSYSHSSEIIQILKDVSSKIPGTIQALLIDRDGYLIAEHITNFAESSSMKVLSSEVVSASVMACAQCGMKFLHLERYKGIRVSVMASADGSSVGIFQVPKSQSYLVVRAEKSVLGAFSMSGGIEALVLKSLLGRLSVFE
eukprot:gnl/Carplike_NY0171/17975_a27837_99.p1 GENE.gnl/Carplike_NY0171/17975_a27837_99~~gnl/Carplike_NY0171/17975_a27837_99.p1  ORF type:complete len:143 (-),score=12.78 gnl/Carplike_NY0171/17975_a27837_99:71-499(-)